MIDLPCIDFETEGWRKTFQLARGRPRVGLAIHNQGKKPIFAA